MENFVKISDIKEIYKECCEKNKIKFSKEKFEEFLKFLEIDFYDWVKENLRCYFRG